MIYEIEKDYVDKQKNISIDDIFSNYSREDLIEIIGVEFLELYLRKKKIDKIKKRIE